MPTDLNQRAKSIVDLASRDDEADARPDLRAVETGRDGGKARAAKMTPEQRSAAAREAARARWESATG
jgi:hypothetical protein